MSYCYQFVNTKHSKYLRWKKYSVYLFMKLIWNENKLLTSCLSYSSFWAKSFLLNYHHYLYNLLTFGRCRPTPTPKVIPNLTCWRPLEVLCSVLGSSPVYLNQVYSVELTWQVFEMWSAGPGIKSHFDEGHSGENVFMYSVKGIWQKMFVYREGRSSRVVKDTACEGK